MDKYLFLGDSLIAGYGVSKENSWINNLHTNTPIINSGVNGNSTADMLYRVSEEISKHNPSYVFIMGGTNDFLLNRSLTHTIDNIILLINEFKNKNIQIQIGIPPYIVSDMAKRLFMPSMNYDYAKNTLPKFREELINICTEENIPYIDFYTLSKNNLKNDIYIDGIHLNKKGHTLMSEEWNKINGCL